MNKFCLILAAALAALLPEKAASAATNADCLSFRDGDLLYGKLLEIQPAQGVRWQHPDAFEPVDFKLDSVNQIDFSPHQLADDRDRGSSAYKLRLANGDLLGGKSVSFDNSTMTLDTWYAGPLKIPRRALQTLAVASRTPVVFDGPTGLDGWTEGGAVKGMTENGEWIYRNGAFYSDKAASIARDLKLPDRSDMQFDMVWRGPLSIAIALYTDSLQPILLTDKENGPDFGGFYSLRFQNTVFVSLTPIRKRDPLRTLGEPLIIQSLTQKDRVHVDLRMSKADRRVALFLDGGLVKDWIDPSGFAGEGTGVRFVNNQAGAAVKISNLRVTKWNGVMEDNVAEAPDLSHDVVVLESGGRVSGAVASIANGQISMQTTAGVTNMPLDGVNAIEFAPYQVRTPSPATAINTRATFVQGGSVTFQLLGWRTNALTAVSPDFGQATFDPAAFGSLQFLAADAKKN